MSASQLNSVLLHQNCRVGADAARWFQNWGGLGLLNAAAAIEQIIPSIKEADLRGLGGSGFPTYKKMQLIAEQTEAEKYLICNGNEDEPGTFKDRLLLEETPLQLIEGASIVALACGIQQVIFYINPQLDHCLSVMATALEQWLASDAYQQMSQQMSQQTEAPIHYKIVPSSGRYIGGEETAAVASIEGGFPFPAARHPLPMESGIHGCPTLINNIETLCHVTHILRKGAHWFNQQGRGKSSGTKLYCLSGDVNAEGVYELPMGTPLSELISVYGQGMRDNQPVKAIFSGGASNNILTADKLDVSLDFDSLHKAGSSLGTGAMIVLAEKSNIVKQVSLYMDFFAEESCGQCPSCKTGTFYMSQLINNIAAGRAKASDLQSLRDLCCILPDTGRCYLINGAVKIVASSLNHFYDDYINSIERLD